MTPINNSTVWFSEPDQTWYADAWASAWGGQEIYVARYSADTAEEAKELLPQARAELTEFFRKQGQVR